MSFDKFASSSIGRKQLMALTGFLLVGFLLAHLAGNFLIFAGYGKHYNHQQASLISNFDPNQQADLKDPKKNKLLNSAPEIAKAQDDIDEIPLNQYALKLKSLGPILWIMRLVLLIIFVAHMFLFYQVITSNKSARPIPYTIKASKGNTSHLSSTMHVTGVVIFAYLIFHLCDFTLHILPNTSIIDGVDEGLYGLVINGFLNPIRSGLYILAMGAIGMHLTHAIQSACQTFGINHPRYTPLIKKASVGLGLVIALGYISIPIFVYIKHGLLGAAQ